MFHHHRFTARYHPYFGRYVRVILLLLFCPPQKSTTLSTLLCAGQLEKVCVRTRLLASCPANSLVIYHTGGGDPRPLIVDEDRPVCVSCVRALFISVKSSPVPRNVFYTSYPFNGSRPVLRVVYKWNTLEFSPSGRLVAKRPGKKLGKKHIQQLLCAVERQSSSYVR